MDYVIVVKNGERKAYALDGGKVKVTKHFHPTSKGNGPNWDKGTIMFGGLATPAEIVALLKAS